MSISSPVAVWDFPTRLFHWSLVGLFAFSWWSAENHEMDWHRLSGITLLGLLVFRIIWGFVGGSTARFSGFIRSPGTLFAYLRGKSGTVRAGHNPLGAYSVVVMLLLLLAQVGTGLFAVDVDGLESGPLSYLVSFDQGRSAAGVHHLSFDLLLATIGLHILAILFYLVFRRRNLLTPMVTGKDRQLGAAQDNLIGAGVVRFVVAAGIAALLAWWVSKGLPM